LPFCSFLFSDKLVLLATRANLFLLGDEPPIRRATLATVETLLAAGTIGPAQGPMRNPFRRAGAPAVTVGATNRGLPASVAGATEDVDAGLAAGAAVGEVAAAPVAAGLATHSPTPVPGWREGLTGAQVAPPEELVQSLMRVFPGQPRGVIVASLQTSQERRSVDAGTSAAEELMSSRR